MIEFFILLALYFLMFVIFCIGLWGIYLIISSGFFTSPPPIPLSGLMKKEMFNLLAEQLKNSSGLTVTDLGSGWGTFLLPLAKKFPQHQFIGIEKNFTPAFISKIRAKKYKNIKIYQEDIFKSNLSQTDIIFCFLMQPLMERLTQYLLANIQKETKIYALRFPLSHIKPQQTILPQQGNPKYDTCYIYTIKRSKR